MRNKWNRELTFKLALDYKNKRDFKTDYIGAYEFLRRNGWLDDATKHMVKPENSNKKWNYSKCRLVALSCETLKEFRLKYCVAYKHSKKNNWLDEFTFHMKKYERPTVWNIEMCREEAKKYNHRTDFNKNSPKAYSACYRNGWLDDVCDHMLKKTKWSKHACHVIALKYGSRKEFQINDRNAYYSARHNEWLDDICQHMVFKKLPNKYWHNFENCKNRALEYKTKTDFINNSQHVYNISLKNGWIGEICAHMIPIGDRYNKCIYSYEFSDNSVYVGLTYNIERREVARRKDFNDAVTKHIRETGIIPVRKKLTEYIPVDEAIKLEGDFLNEYIINNWIPLNRAKTGGIGSRSNKKYKKNRN